MIGFYIVVGIVYVLQGLKRGWGKVYDAGSKKGIGYAFVRLFDAEKNKLVDNQMTEKDGKYVFVLKKPGRYNLLASMRGYSFPSKKEKNKLVKSYFGSLVEVKAEEKDKLLGVELGMDAMSKEAMHEEQLQETQKGERFGSPFGAS